MTALSLDDAITHVTTSDPTFAVCETEIRGISYKVFKNIPPHLRALLQASREAQGSGSADYLVFGDDRWRYDAFCQEIKCLAAALQEQGVGPGTRVALAMRNCPELLFTLCAVASLGGVTVFLNAWWTSEELDYALEDSGAQIVIADGRRCERLKPLLETRALTVLSVRGEDSEFSIPYKDLVSQVQAADWPDTPIHADDDFAIMYSSGTTGHPKGVVLTHRGAMNAVFTWLMQAAMEPLLIPPAADAPPPLRPVGLVVTPLFHVTATHPVFLLSLPAGAKLVLMEKWDAEQAVRLIRDEEVTRMLGVPTQSADLQAAAERMGETLPTLSYLGAGGAKRPAAQVAELADAFPHTQIATGWGMTETNANGIGMIGQDYVARPGALGRLYPPVQSLRFLDDNGEDVDLGEVGEIAVKSPCNMRCYLNKPEATADVLQDGWLRTGDMGFIDNDGIVTIVDRKKNIIIRGGENIACLDVEGALHRHPAVTEACAFALPDDRLGEVVGALVQVREQTTEAALKTFLQEHIAHFKVPERICIQAGPLPRGATDKLDRRGIRDRCVTFLHNKEGTSHEAV